MKSSREQFEEWVKKSGSDMERYKTGIHKGDFKNPVMRKMWLAWQASRAAIIIELPWLGQSSLMDTDDVVEAIESQGLTAKAKL